MLVCFYKGLYSFLVIVPSAHTICFCIAPNIICTDPIEVISYTMVTVYKTSYFGNGLSDFGIFFRSKISCEGLSWENKCHLKGELFVNFMGLYKVVPDVVGEVWSVVKALVLPWLTTLAPEGVEQEAVSQLSLTNNVGLSGVSKVACRLFTISVDVEMPRFWRIHNMQIFCETMNIFQESKLLTRTRGANFPFTLSLVVVITHASKLIQTLEWEKAVSRSQS